MKLANLLAQYLYTNKRLDLPGIGTFLLDPAINIDTEKNKHTGLNESISFKCNPSLHDAPELVSYISEKSGKMRVLAESDLESHLQIVQQFLNINKPFSFEGIGTLVKIKHGEFAFTPGNINPRMKDDPEREKQVLSKKDNVDAKYQAFLATPAVKTPWKKPVIALLILAGIGLAIWGGYTISTNKASEEIVSDNNNESTVAVPDTTANKLTGDTIQQAAVQPESYKYVLEITKAPKVFRRYKQLQDTKLASLLQLETKDSIQYKLFVLLPTSRDTTRVIDSLTAFLGKKVYIERQN
ncbi:MAG TPA: hypothetical protein VFI06_09990 [Chitinophagaceae bacterium]|nr:hypothetical protein [Chitinophagaceae bacterium]